MSLIWYIYFNDVVSGPFSTESVEAGLDQKKWSNQALIWWKGQRDWVSIDVWRKDLSTILESLRNNIQTVAWYAEYLGTQKGPMNSKELQNFVQTNGIIGSCRVWHVGMDRWMSIFEIPELVTYFGITRRKHPRAPFKGDLLLKKASDINDTLIAHAGSISAGGMGVRGLETVRTGEDVNLQLKSPLLEQGIQTNAVVVYKDLGGYTGLEFRDLPKEFESIIVDYVNQFNA
ncbi:MAG: GYF domain-containing protein [Bdellovibrionota bacterium]